MDSNQLTPSQLDFLATLEAFGEPIPIQTAATLSSISVGDLFALVRRLSENGWLQESANDCFGLSGQLPTKILNQLKKINSQERLSKIRLTVTSQGLAESLPTEGYRWFLSRCGQHNENAELAYKEAETDINNGFFERALQNLITCLTLLEAEKNSLKSASLYISAVLKLSIVSQPHLKAWKQAERYLVRGRKLAEKLGDQRQLVFIDLTLGFFYLRREKIEASTRHFRKGMTAVEALGDGEITARSAEFIGQYYFINRGLLEQAFEHFEQAMIYVSNDQQRRLNIYFPLVFGISAAMNGQFYRAVGVLDSAGQHALQENNPMMGRLCQAHLGTVLLMMGKREEALMILERVLKVSDRVDDRFSRIWAQRGIAYYWFLEGDIQQSYNILRPCLIEAVKVNSPRPFFAFPGTLEMLFACHCSGCESIPGIEIEKELAYAQKQDNLLQRGTAERIRALQAEMDGRSLEVVLSFLRKSHDDLALAQAPLELAKTRLVRARLYLKIEDRVKAREEVIAVLQLYGRNDFPDKLSPLIEEMDILPASDDLPDVVLGRYIEMMKRVLPSIYNKEMLSRLIASTSRFFEAEKGGIFSHADKKNQLPHLIIGYNLIPKDFADERFQPLLEVVGEALESDKPIQRTLTIFDPESGSDRHLDILCLPFQASKQSRNVLYYDNTFSEGRYKLMSSAVLSKLADYFSTYIDEIAGFSHSMKEISRQAIVQTVSGKADTDVMVSRHPIMRKLLSRAMQAAPSEAPVLIQGETGVGKELLAHFVHNNSPRRNMPFIAVNFSSIPESLLESELFGHEKGAFTGAVSRKPGLMELADKGTLFIDEVGDIPKAIQVKLLRALQEKTFMRVGGVSEHSSDFRIITATHKNMVQEVNSGNFREDLYYRINIVPLTIPPLRERGEDIIELSNHFLKQYANVYNRKLPPLTLQDRSQLMTHPWLGNVRELRNMIERAVILSSKGCLELALPGDYNIPNVDSLQNNEYQDELTLEEVQRRHIRRILAKTNGKISGPGGAIHILGINRSSLYSRMRKLGMDLKLNRIGEVTHLT